MVDFKPKEHYTPQDLVEIVRLLRDPENGCPWDKEQTHESIRMNFIEETYEVVDAIDLKDKHLLEEELGDVLLQVALHSQMEAEQGSFDFYAVCDALCKKLVFRHPHVFGQVQAENSQQALENWEARKNEEKGRQTAQHRLESVPHSFPALMRAAKLYKRAKPFGFERTPEQLITQMRQQLDKLEQGETDQALGNLLFAAAAYSQCQHQEPEEVLTKASDAYQAGVIFCEQQASEKGLKLEELDDQQRVHWMEMACETKQSTKE